MSNNESILEKSKNRYVKVSDIGTIILELEKSDLNLSDYYMAIGKICDVMDNKYIIIPTEEKAKETLYLLDHYVTTLLNSRICLQLEKGRFNKVDCARLEGEIDALDRIRNFINDRFIKGETE